MRASWAIASVLTAFSCIPAFAQEAQCFAQFEAHAGVRGLFPGSIGAQTGRPCVVPVYNVSGRGRFSVITIVRQPANGTLTPVGVSAIRFTPKPGFSGKDVGIVRFGRGRTSSAIRFAIDVR